MHPWAATIETATYQKKRIKINLRCCQSCWERERIDQSESRFQQIQISTQNVNSGCQITSLVSVEEMNDNGPGNKKNKKNSGNPGKSQTRSCCAKSANRWSLALSSRIWTRSGISCRKRKWGERERGERWDCYLTSGMFLALSHSSLSLKKGSLRSCTAKRQESVSAGELLLKPPYNLNHIQNFEWIEKKKSTDSHVSRCCTITISPSRISQNIFVIVAAKNAFILWRHLSFWCFYFVDDYLNYKQISQQKS